MITVGSVGVAAAFRGTAWAAKVADGRLSDIRPYDKSADATLY